MKKLSLAALGLVATVTVAAPASAQELVTNGGFETGSFSGWTQFVNTGFTNVSTQNIATGGTAAAGTYNANFGPVGSTGGIFQNLATVAGRTYNIAFTLAGANSGPNSFLATFGGTTLRSTANTGAFGNTVFSYAVAATGASSELRFTFQHDPSYFTLDGVSVTAAAAVPEPATWGLMILGFGAVGGAMRSRRRTTRVAFAA